MPQLIHTKYARVGMQPACYFNCGFAPDSTLHDDEDDEIAYFTVR